MVGGGGEGGERIVGREYQCQRLHLEEEEQSIRTILERNVIDLVGEEACARKKKDRLEVGP